MTSAIEITKARLAFLESRGVDDPKQLSPEDKLNLDHLTDCIRRGQYHQVRDLIPDVRDFQRSSTFGYRPTTNYQSANIPTNTGFSNRPSGPEPEPVGGRKQLRDFCLECGVLNPDDLRPADRQIYNRMLAIVERAEEIDAINAYQKIHHLPENVDRFRLRQSYEIACLLSAGISEDRLSKFYSDLAMDGGIRQGSMSFSDLAKNCLMLENRIIPLSIEDQCREALSTVALTNILSSIAEKAVLVGYENCPTTWQKWCSTGSLKDFKTGSRLRMRDDGYLEPVGQGGTCKRGYLADESETVSVASYAKSFVLDRQTLLNDDMGAIVGFLKRIGQISGILPEILAYRALMLNGTMSDGNAVFCSDHNNLNTSSALASSTLGVAMKAMRNQRDSTGQLINLPPRFLIVPTTKEETGRGILSTDRQIIGNDKIELVTSPHIEDARLTGYSATSWYLATDPKYAGNIELSFLNNQMTPTVELVQRVPGYLGFGWRVYHDLGSSPIDYRGLQKSTE